MNHMRISGSARQRVGAIRPNLGLAALRPKVEVAKAAEPD